MCRIVFARRIAGEDEQGLMGGIILAAVARQYRAVAHLRQFARRHTLVDGCLVATEAAI